MRPFNLTLESGSADVLIMEGETVVSTAPLGALAEMSLDAGQHLRVNQTGGDELRVCVWNMGTEPLCAELRNSDDVLAERNYLAAHNPRNFGSTVVLHGWDDDFFLIGTGLASPA